MLIKQISVFIENMPGKLGEVTQVLGENGIDLQLPQDDLVLFALIPLVHPLTPPTVLYVPAPGTGRRRSAPSMPR